MTDSARRLGRGLKALIPVPEAEAAPAKANDLARIAIARIRPNPFQPRKTFNAEQLADLEASLSANGLLQPIVVRPIGDHYELIAGERRLRAATNLGWTEIPALVKDMDDRASLVMALVENLQRTDLDPIEEARGYLRLHEEFGFTHQQIADSTSKDRATITNLLRILSLPEQVIALVASGRLSVGHAKALASLPGPAALALANEVVALGLSVRATEERSRAPGALPQRKNPTPDHASTPTPHQDPAVRAIENELRRRLQTDVQLQVANDGKGSLKISFYSQEDLERLVDIIVPQYRDI
jgi:ParB family transcriptional regulator, chromosome partitioning protein